MSRIRSQCGRRAPHSAAKALPASGSRTAQATAQRKQVITCGETWPGAQRPMTALPAQHRAVTVSSP